LRASTVKVDALLEEARDLSVESVFKTCYPDVWFETSGDFKADLSFSLASRTMPIIFAASTKAEAERLEKKYPRLVDGKLYIDPSLTTSGIYGENIFLQKFITVKTQGAIAVGV
jgi:hypothetical protein